MELFLFTLSTQTCVLLKSNTEKVFTSVLESSGHFQTG